MENNDELMHDGSPLGSPLEPSGSAPARQLRGAPMRFPPAARAAFEQYFLNVDQHPKRAKIEEFAQEFPLQVKQIQKWFSTRRSKAKLTHGTSQQQVVPEPLRAPSLPQADVDSHEEAAKQAFKYLTEETIIRMLKYFEDHALNEKTLPMYAQQIQVPAPIVAAFAKWRTQRIVDKMGTQPHLNPSQSVTPSRSTPQTTVPAQDHIDICKMEVDDAAASLPTPQPSVALSPSSSRTNSLEPEIAHVSFYDTWLEIQAIPLESRGSTSEGASEDSILQLQLPSDVANFAFGTLSTPP